MFLSNPAKSFLAVSFILLAAGGCGWLRPAENTVVPAIPKPKERFPFKTKEPDTFQCEIVQTAGGSVRRTRLARKAGWRRLDFDYGERHQMSVLRTDKEYLLDAERQVYAEKAKLAGNTVEPQFSDLTHELLFAGVTRSNFQEVGTEGNLIKFRSSTDENAASETVLFYDPAIGLPVKQEFYSINNGERSLEFTVEIVNFKIDIDEGLFVIPNAFRMVSMTEFQKKG